MFSFNWLWLEIASETVKKSASLRAIAKFEFGLEVLKWRTDEIVKLQLTFSLNLNWLGRSRNSEVLVLRLCRLFLGLAIRCYKIVTR